MSGHFTDERYFLVRFEVTSEPDKETWKAQGRYQKGLADQGILLMCGPLGDHPGTAMAVLKAAGRADAEAVYRLSPIVQKGHARITVEPWTVSVRTDSF